LKITSKQEEDRFAAPLSGGFLDIVKKGYAHDADHDPRHPSAFPCVLAFVR
jgi:hypothetical protein